jgi:predicted DsbA family dithiol-disulfide isomerase
MYKVYQHPCGESTRFLTFLPGFIGKKHLHRAMEHVLQAPLAHAPRPLKFSIVRVPFFLEPLYDESKPFVCSNRQRLIEKWGGVAGWELQKKQHDLKGRGMEAGIPHFNLDRLAGNTMASHRLIQMLGKTYGLHISETIYDVLNTYYFVDGHSLNDRPRLAKVVVTKLEEMVPNAPTEASILDFLNGDEGREEIENAVNALHQLGIHGIPKFIIEGFTVVDGAAHSDVFIDIFRRIEERGTVMRGPIFGDILGIPLEVLEQGSHGSMI